MAELPSTARVVIIGGGAIGCSILYHLAKMGWSDCLLLEKNELTSGSSWHAAGNCPNFSGSLAVMKMQAYSNDLFTRLGDEVDYPMNYHVTGSVRLAHTQDRMDEFRHVTAMANNLGLEMDMVANEQMKEVYPFMETHDVLGGVWDPNDGDIDPAQLTQAYAKGARNLGAKVIRFCPVSGVRRENDEWVIETEKGEVRCEYVVNAAGYRAQEVGRMFGREVPCVTMAHQYLITEEIPELEAHGKLLPLLRDPDSSYYLRQEKNGLLLGPYETQATPHWVTKNDPMPEDFSFQLYPDDLERLEWYIEDACARVPLLGTAGVTRVVNGPIPYAPDGNPLIGPMPGVPNAFEACVFTFGIVQSGGAGKVCAEWIVEGETEGDMWAVDPRRFTGYATKEYSLEKAKEIYAHEYAIHFPAQEWPAGRQARTSPLYEKLKGKGAMFGAAAGWERPVWFPRAGKDEAVQKASYHHTNWFDAVREECLAIRDKVGLMDLCGFSRFEVSGEGAAEWLRGMVTGALPKAGRIGLIYFATEKGKILTEMTITRFSEDHFLLITAAAAEWHDLDWLQTHIPDGSPITITNKTGSWTTLVVAGAKSRELLSSVCDKDFSNAAFPWLTHQPIEIGMARGFAIRVSYVGELGWELHLPIEHVLGIYDKLWAAGEEHGIIDFGMYAMESMRLEKGYRAWKHDLTNDYSMFEGGLERFVRLDKPTPFIGQEALRKEKEEGIKQMFVPLLLEDGSADAMYLSTVWKGDERIGFVTSGGYGHRIGKSIALATIRTDCTDEGAEVEVEVLGERRKAVVARDPLYDPENERLRA